MAQTLIQNDSATVAITPSLIANRVDTILSLDSSWAAKVNKEAVAEELIRRFSIWVGKSTTLVNNVGHIPWLTSSRKTDWKYWHRYQEYLEQTLPITTVDSIDDSTTRILELLEDPRRLDRWDRRGLVVGHVQSGKTGNYTGLICKAADAGYKIIIVLAGIHNSLRSQTQMRLDEGFLGYETNPDPGLIRVIGVGEIDSDTTIRPDFATTRVDKGDFSKKLADTLGITPEARPTLFVVKKNKSVLSVLHRWIQNRLSDGADPETGRRLVERLPILLIDDEADHASVDTGVQLLDEDGQPDLQHQPTEINKLIRRILHSFTHAAYVGYTATPFANIFIHEKAVTTTEGPDLFPAAFIQNLSAPSNYIGPRTVFQPDPQQLNDLQIGLLKDVYFLEGENGKALIDKWMPPNHKSTHSPRFNELADLPSSMIHAINTFLVVSAVKELRKLPERHSSMLIHVTRFTNVQSVIGTQVEAYVQKSRQRIQRGIDSRTLEAVLKAIWLDEIVPTSSLFSQSTREDGGLSDFAWNEVYEAIGKIVGDIKVRRINGTAKDVLDYKEHRTLGLKVIAIGGDKLSRGLTLEGLCVSYFLRASKMYDTLMQMGRWFGYRRGYADLCRLYTTTELIEWFGHIANAADELREEFETMSSSGSTPREFGLKVQSHPVLMVTSPMKMRSARELQISFSGSILETTTFHPSLDIQRSNFLALRNLVARLGLPSEGPKIVRNRPTMPQTWQGFLWGNRPPVEVIDFLREYKTSNDARKVNSFVLADFISNMSVEGELTNWNIAIVGGGGGPQIRLTEQVFTDAIRRTATPNANAGFSIGRLLSPRDESIDVTNAVWSAALEDTQESWKSNKDPQKSPHTPDTPSGSSIRKILGPNEPHQLADLTRGLLLLYIVDPNFPGFISNDLLPGLVSFGISLPRSNCQARGTYMINNVEWENLYGSSE